MPVCGVELEWPLCNRPTDFNHKTTVLIQMCIRNNFNMLAAFKFFDFLFADHLSSLLSPSFMHIVTGKKKILILL